MKSETYTLHLTFLTPVHAGTGDELEPFSYVLHSNGNGTARLHLVDLEGWVRDSSGDPDVIDAFENRDVAGLRRFVAERIPLEKYTLDVIPVAGNKFTSLYSEVLSGKREEHRLLLDKTHRSPADGLPFLPGSSLKGAVRTAVGNAHVDQAGRPFFKKEKRNYDWQGYNHKIFGKIQNDIFKFLKVGDIKLGPGRTQIVEPVEVSKNPERTQSTPKNFAEATHSLALGEPLNARAKLQIASPHQKFQIQGLVQPFDLPQLMAWLNSFYIPKYFQEMKAFYELPHLSRVKKHLEPVTEKVQKLEKDRPHNSALVRVGHYSHVECVTYDNVRDPKARKGWGKTRTLAEATVPFGWILLQAEPGYIPEQDIAGQLCHHEKPQTAPDLHSDDKTAEPSLEDTRKTRLDDLQKGLNAVQSDKIPGTLPGIAQKVLEDSDPEYAREAARLILEFVRASGRQKKLKAKPWYKDLQELAGREG